VPGYWRKTSLGFVVSAFGALATVTGCQDAKSFFLEPMYRTPYRFSQQGGGSWGVEGVGLVLMLGLLIVEFLQFPSVNLVGPAVRNHGRGVRFFLEILCELGLAFGPRTASLPAR
jgi:hypothetical protein